MKNLHFIALLCCISLPFLAQAQTSKVHIAGSDYPAQFGDVELSFTNQQRIASDLTLIFSLAPSFEELKSTAAENGGVSPKNGIAMFGLSEASEGIFLVDQDNRKSIRVDKVASDRYLKAFTLMNAHSNAVQKSREFVALMNSPDLLSQPIQTLRNLFHIQPLSDIAEEEFTDDWVREFVTEMHNYRYPEIPALNFFLQRLPQVNNAEVLVTGVYMVEKTNPPPERVYGRPIDFYHGRWGFGRTPLDISRDEIVELE